MVIKFKKKYAQKINQRADCYCDNKIRDKYSYKFKENNRDNHWDIIFDSTYCLIYIPIISFIRDTINGDIRWRYDNRVQDQI